MEKRKRKTFRTNRAVTVEELETLEVVMGILIEEAMNEFIQAKQAEHSAPRTIRDYQTHFRYLRSWTGNSASIRTNQQNAYQRRYRACSMSKCSKW